MSDSGNTSSGGTDSGDDWGGKEETPWQQQPPPSQPPPDQQQPPQYGQQPPPQYGQQPPQYGGQQYGGPPTHQPGAPLQSYLVHSIIATLLCCLPAGVVGIIYAAQVNSKLAAGDYAGAKKASDSAKLWCIISVAAAFLFWVVYLAIAASVGGY